MGGPSSSPARLSPMMRFCPPAGTPLPDALLIKPDTSRSYAFGEGIHRCELFLTNKNSTLFAYINDCPHAHTPLDWQPDRFLDREKQHILCGTHGALFQVNDGKCVEGPCVGRQLTPVPIILGAQGVEIGPKTADHWVSLNNN